VFDITRAKENNRLNIYLPTTKLLLSPIGNDSAVAATYEEANAQTYTACKFVPSCFRTLAQWLLCL